MAASSPSPGFVYTLKLRKGRFYVGWSANPITRIEQHLISAGSEWTCLFPPLSVHDIFPGDKCDEIKQTQKMMREFGWENVRGGPWCSPFLAENPLELSEESQEALFLNHLTDACHTCGRTGHYSIDCPSKRAPLFCSKCGRTNHTRENCFAHTSKAGYTLKRPKCHRCGREGHFRADCFAKTDVDGKKL